MPLLRSNVLKENELSYRVTFSLFTLSNPIKSVISLEYTVPIVLSHLFCQPKTFVAPGEKDKGYSSVEMSHKYTHGWSYHLNIFDTST